MDLQCNSIPLSSICEGCLSVDRKLITIYNDESSDQDESCKFFNEILDPMDFITHPLGLCWECTATVQKITRFRKQVKYAHDCLVKYMLHQTNNLTSLSNLTTNNDHVIKEMIYFEFDTLKDEDGKSSLPTLAFMNSANDENGPQNSRSDETFVKNSECDEATGNDCDINDIRPLFVKMEDDDDVNFEDVQGFYIDDSVGDRTNEESDDKDFKTIISSDIFQNEVPVTDKKTTKSKKARRKNKVDDFDESDDEPLKLKKQKEEGKEYKPRGRRKKKENDGTKIDGRKHPSPRLEKRAGVVDNARVNRKLAQLNMTGGRLQMVVLSWQEVEEERQRALSSAVFTRLEYRCYDCVLGFNHRIKLENHMKKHDQSSGEMSCNVCRVRCRNTHALRAHKRRHRVRWRCCACGETWSRAAVAADHYARAHGAPPATHTCSACGHQEPTLGKLRNHMKNHAERQKCELCGKTFRDTTSLRTHLFIHRGEKEYSCPRCSKRFLFKKAMEVHLVTHNNSEQLYCYQCDMNFKNRMSYYQHMKYNLKHIDPAKLKYACQLCDKKFVKAARLEEHNVAVHLKVTPIQCTTPGCNFACSSRPVLRTHIRMVHRNLRAVRNHVCDTCGKAYTTKKTLEGHMRTHTGERPFHCQHCPSTFGYEAALYNHNKLVHLKAKRGRGRAAPVPSTTGGPTGPPGGPPAPPAPIAWHLTLNPIAHIQHNDIN